MWRSSQQHKCDADHLINLLTTKFCLQRRAIALQVRGSDPDKKCISGGCEANPSKVHLSGSRLLHNYKASACSQLKL
jgi:hypothetical protein